MTRACTLVFLTLLAFATPAQGLKLIIWDRELQTKLGYGETNGSRMVVQLVKDFKGPIIALFSREDDEKARNLYPNLQNRFDGTLKAGQLTLDVQNRPISLSQFLNGLKLTLVLEPVGQVFTLPGLRAATDKPTPDRAEGGR